MKSLRIVLIVCTYSLLIPSESVDPKDNSRLSLLDKQMRNLNLKKIHFEDPSGVVKPRTIINRFYEKPQDIREMLKKKVNETAEKLANGTAQEKMALMASAIDVPLPSARQIQSALSRG